MRKLYIVIVVVAAAFSFSFKAAAQSAQFLNINPDAEVTSMGGAGVASDATAFAFYNNGASTLFSQKRLGIGFSYTLWQPDGTDNSMIAASGYGKIGEKFSILAGFKYFGYNSYIVTDDYGIIWGEYTPKEYQVGAGVAYKVLPLLALTANINYIGSSLGDDLSANAVAADIGAMVDLKLVNIGLSLSNLGSKLKYDNQKSALPANLKVGVSTTRNIGKSSFSAVVQGGYMLESSAIYAGIGARYLYNDRFYINAGYHYGSNDDIDVNPSHISLGAGIRLFGVSLNAAYLTGTNSESLIKNTLQFTLTLML